MSPLRAFAGAAVLLASLYGDAQQPDAPSISSPKPVSLTASLNDLNSARQLIAKNSFPQAESLLREYLEANSSSAAAHSLLAYCLLRQNRPREALPEYTQAARLEPPSATDLKNVAQAYALLEDYPDALKWATLSVEQGPADPDAWYNLGRIHYTLLHFPAAVDCFRKVLALAPKSMKAENNLGLALEGLNRNDEAVAAYRQAIALGAEAATPQGLEQPLLNLAIVLVHRGSVDEALPLLSRAASIAPRDPHIHEQLGHLYLQKEDLARAATEFEQALAIDPSRSSLHFLLGQTYRRQGLNNKAQIEFARAAAIMGTHSSKD